MEIFFKYTSVEECIGATLSLIYLYLSIKKNIWLWPVGLIASGFYVVVYFNAKLYAEMGLQVYYIAVSIYGWYYWLSGRESKDDTSEIPVRRITKKDTFVYLIAFGAFYLVLFYILGRYTDSPIPGWDSLATSLSLVATWMLAKKILENWLIWIIADAMCIAISYYKNLYFTTVLFVVYTIIAVVGYFKWKKSLA